MGCSSVRSTDLSLYNKTDAGEGAFQGHTLPSLLDKLDVIECFEQ